MKYFFFSLFLFLALLVSIFAQDEIGPASSSAMYELALGV